MNCFQSLRTIRLLSQCLLALTLLVLSVFNAKADLSNNEVSKSIASKDFVMKDLAGKEHRLSDYRGKWVLINYWATWCPPCLDELPDFISLYEQRYLQAKSKDLMVLGIAVDYKNAQEVRLFVDDMLVSYPIILGTPKIFAQFGSPKILPTTLIYNPQGKLVKLKQGQLTKLAVESIIMASPHESIEK